GRTSRLITQLNFYRYNGVLQHARRSAHSVFGVDATQRPGNRNTIQNALNCHFDIAYCMLQRNVALVFPWVIVTLYGLYYNHYKSLSKMTTVLRSVRHATGLPWLALFVTSIGLGKYLKYPRPKSITVLRVFLVLKVLHLAAHLWYRKKLEKELYEPIG
ncbi:hypothetical protein NQ317_017612, partial [Molorchus minor]